MRSHAPDGYNCPLWPVSPAVGEHELRFRRGYFGSQGSIMNSPVLTASRVAVPENGTRRRPRRDSRWPSNNVIR